MQIIYLSVFVQQDQALILTLQHHLMVHQVHSIHNKAQESRIKLTHVHSTFNRHKQQSIAKVVFKLPFFINHLIIHGYVL